MRALGMIQRPHLAMAGPYRKSGDLRTLAPHYGMEVFNAFDFAGGTGMKPLDPAQVELAQLFRRRRDQTPYSTATTSTSSSASSAAGTQEDAEIDDDFLDSDGEPSP
jgi:hypothetical protein